MLLLLCCFNLQYRLNNSLLVDNLMQCLGLSWPVTLVEVDVHGKVGVDGSTKEGISSVQGRWTKHYCRGQESGLNLSWLLSTTLFTQARFCRICGHFGGVFKKFYPPPPKKKKTGDLPSLTGFNWVGLNHLRANALPGGAGRCFRRLGIPEASVDLAAKANESRRSAVNRKHHGSCETYQVLIGFVWVFFSYVCS